MKIIFDVPEVDEAVLDHHRTAVFEIEQMSPSQSYGAETNLRGWRRNLTAIKLKGSNGYAFEGNSLTVGHCATLGEGAILIAYDSSWAKARWYEGRYIKPIEQSARILRIAAEGPELIFKSETRTWARDILDYLASNRALCDAAGIRVLET